MGGSGARPPPGSFGPSGEGQDFTLEGLRGVANGAQMPFLAYLLNMALEEANNGKSTFRDPERSAASTTTTPSEIPEMRRFRRGNSLPRGEKRGARSLMRRPCSLIARCSSSFSGG